MQRVLRVFAGIAIIGSTCVAIGLIRLAYSILRYGFGNVLGGSAKPLPAGPYESAWLWASLIIGSVLAVTLTRGRRK
jgi:hypothetical protein